MNNISDKTQYNKSTGLKRLVGFFSRIREKKNLKYRKRIINPFWVMVQKEVADHVKSWRFIILMAIIALTCMGSLRRAGAMWIS